MGIQTMTVTLSDGIRYPEDYTPPRTYSITAVLEFPEPADVQKAVDMIKAAGNNYLGRTAPVADAAVETNTPRPGEPGGARTRTRKPKATEVVEAPVIPSVLHEPDVIEHIEANKVVADPMAGVVAQPEAAPVVVAEVVKADDLSDVLGETVVITDEQLGAAVRRRNGELGATGPTLIRALLNSYNPEPESRVFQLKEVPAASRAEFLDRLNALTAA